MNKHQHNDLLLIAAMFGFIGAVLLLLGAE